MEQAPEGADAVHRVKRGRPAKAVQDPPTIVTLNGIYPVVADNSAAQAYALRIWDGQSVDVSIPDRVERVVNGLRGQNMSIAVTLPHPDAARFLAKHQ